MGLYGMASEARASLSSAMTQTDASTRILTDVAFFGGSFPLKGSARASLQSPVDTASREEKHYHSTMLLSPRIQMEDLPLCTFPEWRPFITEAMTGELKQPSLSENGLCRAVLCHTVLASLIRRDEALTQGLMA
ncbi:Heat shock protein beta-3 [Dissostichus eleginoides]|uniref:Heat shock protein beta-3 n=1 Tax=Dissostichus eleginoides TaxID=100907 RepID=A0AAD9C3P4_DISEL|nr:Heat shock protein beta-3 [Dissostichus eleginoides]